MRPNRSPTVSSSFHASIPYATAAPIEFAAMSSHANPYFE